MAQNYGSSSFLMLISLATVLLAALFPHSSWFVSAFHYPFMHSIDAGYGSPLVAPPPLMYSESNAFPNYESFQPASSPLAQQYDQLQQADSFQPNHQQLWQQLAQSQQNRYIDENAQTQQSQQQQQRQYQPWQSMMPDESRSSVSVNTGSDSVCQNGFVEHCLVQANSDGERSLLAAMAANMTGDEQRTLASEFDGMCSVVIRFIDCLNEHHVKCGQGQQGSSNVANNIMKNKDMFYQSWIELCSPQGHIRNNYLQHAKCIRESLSQDNRQDECQSRFQSYFMSSQFSMDSMDNAVQFGCCAFNEWQHCIDSLIVKQCGHDAVISVQNLIEKASGGLVSSLCDQKAFGRKSKACLGKKSISSHKLQMLDPKVNATLQKYIGIFGDFIDRLPDDDETTSD